MVVSAALLLRERGIARTRFDDVIEHAGAPRGSIAHHFPEGKRQLVAEAVLWAGAQATRALRAAADGGTSADLVRVIVGVYRRALVDSEFAAGCPVGMVALEGHHDDELARRGGRVFDDWRAVLGETLTREGHDERAAQGLASVMIASIEGRAHARARRSRRRSPGSCRGRPARFRRLTARP
jgi:AcrR family transcriptional regulator